MSHDQLFQRFPSALFATCRDGRCGERQVGIAIQVGYHPQLIGSQFDQPADAVKVSSTSQRAIRIAAPSSSQQKWFAPVYMTSVFTVRGSAVLSLAVNNALRLESYFIGTEVSL